MTFKENKDFGGGTGGLDMRSLDIVKAEDIDAEEDTRL